MRLHEDNQLVYELYCLEKTQLELESYQATATQQLEMYHMFLNELNRSLNQVPFDVNDVTLYKEYVALLQAENVREKMTIALSCIESLLAELAHYRQQLEYRHVNMSKLIKDS